ncbi:XdhC family protein [Candidatus Pelagibacter sp.]|uniref:XdhC family protein n=1 Tax=Candidatus Pelagibacter sp. TaxID=2024849 RepID=UPI003F879B30
MKIETLKEIIEKKLSNEQFTVLTNLSNGSSEIFKIGTPLSKNFISYKDEIENYYNLKKSGVIDDTEIFIQNYIKPVEVIIVGAVHIAQYLIEFLKHLNFNITIIDPREYFVSKQKFQNIKIINKWPDEAFENFQTNSNMALITLTHDPKIDDPALKHALKQKFFYIGALGSKKTHENRCKRLNEDGFNDEEIASIHGPIGIKLGGKSAPEIALSIVAQLVSEINKF